MVGKCQVDSTSVNIQRFTQILHRHRRTFDMPTGPPFANFCLPEMFARLWRLPQREVARVFFFVAVVVDSRARLNPGQINLRKLPILRKLRDPVINRSVAFVGECFLLQPLDQLHHVRNVIRRTDPVLRRFHT